MKKSLITIFLLAIPFSNIAYPNAAMPGFWNVGTGQVFTPFFKEEEKYSEKIKMNSEVVKVLLYKGFAIVKGEYNMINLSNKDIKIHVGYPDHGVFRNEKVRNIIFNKLDNLEVKVNGVNKKISFSESNEDLSNGKWFIWENNFKANKETKIEVYYMIDTHFSFLRSGYNSESGNGFSYIIESGKIWSDKIGKGNILIKLQEDLSYNNILGVLPEKLLSFYKDANIIEYSFSNLEPTDKDNIVIRYENLTPKEFDYNKIKFSYKNYYKEIDNSNFLTGNDKEVIEKNDFNITDKVGIFIISLISFVVLLFVGIVYFIISKFLKKKK